MRIPRDISGDQLAKRLSRFGYVSTRQTGSHVRLTTQRAGEHHITIPAHDPVRVGTLNAIILDAAAHLNVSKEDVLRKILD